MTRSSVTRPSAKRYLHHCSVRSEKNQRAVDKLITLSSESLLSSQSLSVCHVSTERPVNERGSLSSCSSREMANETREELHKSHVLKVKEFSRRKLTESLPRSNFILPGLECQDSLTTLVTTTRSTQMLMIDDEHTRNSLASHTVLSGARSKCELVAGLSLAKEKACFKVHSQF